MGGGGQNKIRRHFWKMLVKLFLLQIFSGISAPFDGYLKQFMRRIDSQSESIRKVSFTS